MFIHWSNVQVQNTVCTINVCSLYYMYTFILSVVLFQVYQSKEHNKWKDSVTVILYLYLRLYLAHAGRDINLIYPGLRYLYPSLSGTKKLNARNTILPYFSTDYMVCFINLSHSLTISLRHGHNLHRRTKQKGKLVNWEYAQAFK